MKDVARDIFLWIRHAVFKIGWLPVAVFAFHQIAARLFDAYNVFPLLDVPMHFLGGVAIGVFIWVLFNSEQTNNLIGNLTRLGHSLVSFMGVFVAVSLWEFAEWSTDRLGFSHAQLSIDDTMLDMFLGALGGGLAIIMSKYFS